MVRRWFLWAVMATSRLAGCIGLSHWALIAGAALVGPLEVATEIAADWTPYVALVLTVGIAALVVVVNRDGHASDRMLAKAREAPRHSIPMAFGGLASGAGGIALLMHGQPNAAGWAMVMGLVVGMCETVAITAAVIRATRDQARGDKTRG